MILAFLITIVLVVAMVHTLIQEARRTSWSVLEGLIIANLLGHVVAYPIYHVLKDDYYRGDERTDMVVYALLVGSIIAAFMASGAVWAFRRLNALGETHLSTRLYYMVLGLLLFPSIICIPINLLLGWLVWVPLFMLNERAVYALRMREQEARRAARLEQERDAPTSLVRTAHTRE